MRLSIFLDPQEGMTYDEISRAWLRGYEAVGVDHVMLAYAPRGDEGTIETLGREVLPAFQERSSRESG
jgi:hypothetical protein